MLFGFFEELFSDPRGFLLVFLLALPGRMLAISAHESAHGWVAERCGDPTARVMGRITLNPLKHFDVVGTLCMLLVGFGWAKPVPVNPLHFRNYRKDDLKVSLAGVTMNAILFLLNCLVMYGMIWVALGMLPYHRNYYLTTDVLFRTKVDGTAGLWVGEGWYRVKDLLTYPWICGDELIAPVMGQTMGYLFQMVYYSVSCNLVLAVFNLIPVPPLDGYHVLNDLVLKRPLFADQKAQVFGMAMMVALLGSGYLDKALSWVIEGVMGGVGQAVLSVLQMAGLF